jgi:voltage-dependent calcium channel L type alpha-1D
MVVMSQVVNWAPMMYKAMNSNGPDKVAGYKVDQGVPAFFIVFIIFGAFFITNLFVGVVISAYNRESERLGKDFLLTDKQKKWRETKVLVLKMRPKVAMIRPLSNKLR